MRNIKLFEKGTNINLIVKTVGNSCNIECSYCFEKIKNVKKQKYNKFINKGDDKYVYNKCTA